VLDVAGSRSWSGYRRVLDPEGTLVIVGGPKDNRLLGPLSHIVRMRVAAVPGRRRSVFFVAKVNRPALEDLRRLIEDGKVTPVIDRTHELAEITDAFRYLGEGHARGKIVITV
jgi:NADPH:quinone reductase-like Zn-dependent oxidoreductase